MERMTLLGHRSKTQAGASCDEWREITKANPAHLRTWATCGLSGSTHYRSVVYPVARPGLWMSLYCPTRDCSPVYRPWAGATGLWAT
jgi:hypothetical protein